MTPVAPHAYAAWEPVCAAARTTQRAPPPFAADEGGSADDDAADLAASAAFASRRSRPNWSTASRKSAACPDGSKPGRSKSFMRVSASGVRAPDSGGVIARRRFSVDRHACRRFPPKKGSGERLLVRQPSSKDGTGEGNTKGVPRARGDSQRGEQSGEKRRCTGVGERLSSTTGEEAAHRCRSSGGHGCVRSYARYRLAKLSGLLPSTRNNMRLGAAQIAPIENEREAIARWDELGIPVKPREVASAHV